MAKWGGRGGADDVDAPDAGDGADEPEFGSTEWLLAQLNGGRPPAEPRSPLLDPVEQAAPNEPAFPALPITPAAWAPAPAERAEPQGEYPPTAAFPILPAADAAPASPPSQWAEPALPVPSADVAPASAFAPPPLPFDAFDPSEAYAVPRPIQPDFFEAKQPVDDALPPFVLQPPAPAVPVAPVAAAPAEPVAAEPFAAAEPEPFVPAAPFKPATPFVPAVAQIPAEKLPNAQPPIDRVPGIQPPVEQTFTAAFLTPADELAGMFDDGSDAGTAVDDRSAADEASRSHNDGRAAAAGGFAAASAASAAAPAAEAPVFQWGLIAGDETPAETTDAAEADIADASSADAAELKEPQPAASVDEEIADTPVIGAFFGRKRDLDQFAAAAAEKAGGDTDADSTSDDMLADWLAASLPSADGAGAQSGPPALITPPEHDEAPLEIPSVGAPFKPQAPYVPAAKAAAPALGTAAASGQSAASDSPFAGLTPTALGASSGVGASAASGSGGLSSSGSGSGGSGSGSGASGSGGSGKKPTKLVIAIAAVAGIAVLGGLFALGTALPKIFGGDASSDVSSSSAEPAPAETLPPAPIPEGMQPAGEHAWDTLYGGECIDPFTSQWAETFTVVDCAAPHAAQLVFRGQLGGEESTLFPGEEALSGQINALCGAPGIVDMAAAAGYGDLQLQGSFPVTEEQWNSGQHSYFCFVSQVSGEPLTGSLAGPGPAV